jgi:hypothetical protein
MSLYKSNKVWHNYTKAEKKVILFSFPNFLFLNKEDFDKRKNIEEVLFNMIFRLCGVVPDESGMYSQNNFILFWEDESPSARFDETTLKNLGCVIQKVKTQTDTANAMAGIPSWNHTVYIKIE